MDGSNRFVLSNRTGRGMKCVLSNKRAGGKLPMQ